MLDRHKGYFEIPMSMIDDDKDVVKRIMGKCIIIRAETLWMNGNIEYHAICDEFREIEPSEIAPKYVWLVEGDNVRPIEYAEYGVCGKISG